MSHFVAVVLVPKDTPAEDIPGVVEGLLEPYNEQIEVAPYDEECYCVNSAARRAIRPGTSARLDAARAEFVAPEGADEDEVDQKWREFIKPILEEEDALMQAHPEFNKPKPDCEECNGTGVRQTTYNPKSKWDWWRIGGRWDGWLRGLEALPGDGFNFGPQYESAERNICPVMEISPPFPPFAIVLPDGTWAEKGEMGWWGIVSNAKDKARWEEQTQTIFAQYADCIAVAVDMHI